VGGIPEKLRYANDAGLFSRVILPNESLVPQEVHDFAENLRYQKRIEINYCATARSAADAMQASGWRRAAFMRMPATQREFSKVLSRLFNTQLIENGGKLSSEDSKRHKPWTKNDSKAMDKFGKCLISQTRVVTFVERGQLEREVESLNLGSAEQAIGKWLARKDHEIRNGLGEGDTDRGPGLGILCLRTTDSDNEMRLWSNIADILSANPDWWKQFQWADVGKAAKILAELLNNRSADSLVSFSSAPDIVVIFDEGNLTCKNTKRIFPDDFRGQFRDLLTPSNNDITVPIHLSDSLTVEEGFRAALGQTRIIVVFGKTNKAASLPDAITADERECLNRLAIFRFGFSIQAAHSILNFSRENKPLDWDEAKGILENLKGKNVIFLTRNQYYIEPRFLAELCSNDFLKNPKAHLHAARIFAPILEPRRTFLSVNRDRLLEPEPLSEATWHVNQASALTPPRKYSDRVEIKDALARLIFLRPSPDWDTVKQLQSAKSFLDAVNLARRLLVSEQTPHSSRVALALNAIGDYGKGDIADSERQALVIEAIRYKENALANFSALSDDDKRRQKRKLFSEFAYCLRCLKVPPTNRELIREKYYLAETVDEIVAPDFYTNCNLDSYPISKDWMRTVWEDKDKHETDKARSRHAYAASRLYVGRWESGAQIATPWDQPWIECFALASPASFATAQIATRLKTWHKVYGVNLDRATEFGRRVRDFQSYKSKSTQSGEKVSWWRVRLQMSADNLFSFLSKNEDPLRGKSAEIAAYFLMVTVLQETVPTFEFLKQWGGNFYGNWLRLFQAQQTQALATHIQSSHAGWIVFLSQLEDTPTTEIPKLVNWLQESSQFGTVALAHDDPEGLINQKNKNMKLVKEYYIARQGALNKGAQALAHRNGTGFAIKGNIRRLLDARLREIKEG